MFILENGRSRSDIITLYNCPKGGCNKVKVSLFSEVTSNKTRCNYFNQKHQDPLSPRECQKCSYKKDLHPREEELGKRWSEEGPRPLEMLAEGGVEQPQHT